MLRWMVAAVVLLAGCDRLFGLLELPKPDARVGDTASDDVVAIDAPIDPVGDAAEIDGAIGAVCHAAFAGDRYHFVATTRTWDQAESDCRGLQVAGSTRFSHLAVVTDQIELNAMVQITGVLTSRPWVGYMNPNAGQGDQPLGYMWVTFEVTGTTPWAPGQPDQTSQNCALITNNVDFDNDNCGVPYPYICECDNYPPTI